MENIEEILSTIEKEGFYTIDKKSDIEVLLKTSKDSEEQIFVLSYDEMMIFEELKKLLDKNLSGDKEEDDIEGEIDSSESSKNALGDEIDILEEYYLQTKSKSNEELKKIELELIELEDKYKKELAHISIMKQLLNRKANRKTKIKDYQQQELKTKVEILRNTCFKIQETKKKKKIQEQTQTQTPTQAPTKGM